MQLNIATIGDSNSGKSTLWNALLGQKVLPTAAKCSTAVLTHMTLVNAYRETPLMITQGGDVVEGVKEVNKAIRAINDSAREKETFIRDVAIRTGARGESLQVLNDGTLKFIDVPGHTEVRHEGLRECLQVALRLCPVVFAVVKYDQVETESTKRLLDVLMQDMPHVSHAGGITGTLAFIITQADLVHNTLDDSDEEFEDLSKQKVEDLKLCLRRFLQKMGHEMGLEPPIVEAPIFAVSAKQAIECRHGIPMFDWALFQQHVRECHANRGPLLVWRKKVMANNVYRRFKTILAEDGYPMRAAALIDAKKKAADTLFWNQVKLGLFALSIPVALVGGWAAAPAYLAVMNGVQCGVALGVGGVVGMGVGAVATVFTNATVVGDTITIGAGVGAIGALAAEKLVNFNPTYEDIVNCRNNYQDTRLHPGCGSPEEHHMPAYIGEFRGARPHGKGRVFWKDTGREAMIGSFRDGKMERAFIIDEHDVVIGQFNIDERGDLEVSGWQPQSEFMQSDGNTLCILCMGAPTMLTISKVLQPCNHSSVCLRCAESILEAEEENLRRCPVCRQTVSRIARIS